MLKSLKWRVLLCSVPLILLSGTIAPVLGNHPLSTTVYEAPAATVLALPTSYVVPTSYVLPSTYVSTSYVVPTTYVSTSYVVPTTYATTYLSPTYYLSPTSYVVPTYYRTRGLFRRRAVYSTSSYYVPTVYYPSLSYLPTVYDVPVVTAAASSAGCDEVTSASGSPAPAGQPSPAGSGARGPGAAERAPSPPIESTPNEPPPPSQGRSSAVEPQPKAEPTLPPPGQDLVTPPPPVAPTPEGTTNPNLPAPPPAPQPANPAEVPPGGAGQAAPREVRKPAVYPSQALASRSNVLAGKVVAGETGQPEENVRVTVSSRVGGFADRTGTTDAYGHYAIRLPDGDWTVKVAMPSGRAFDVSRITASGGQITDDRGRDVPSLTITR